METHTKANCIHINPSVLWVYFMDWNLAIGKSFHYVHNKVNERDMVITCNIVLIAFCYLNMEKTWTAGLF